MKKLCVLICLFILFFLHLPVNAQITRAWKIIPTTEVIDIEEAQQYIDEINKIDTSSVWRLPKNNECTADKNVITKIENFKYNTNYLIMLYWTKDDEITETGEWDYATITFYDPIPSPLFINGIGYSTYSPKGKLLLVSEIKSPLTKKSDNGGGCFITTCSSSYPQPPDRSWQR